MNDAYWNEVCRILNQEFFAEGQEITPELLQQLLRAVGEMLTD